MSRKPRIESSEGLYHIFNRGNYRSWIFETESARDAFQKALFEACVRNGWKLLAFCIMTNHFHLCLGTPRGNLSEGMRWLQATFAIRFNRFRKENGHLFQGRFKSLLVEPGEHLTVLVNYIHLNPLRAGLEDAQSLGKYRWSSLWHFPKRNLRTGFMDASWMDCLSQVDDRKGGWIRYRNLLKLRILDNPEEIDKLEKRMNRGWCIGNRDFKKAVAKDYLSQQGLMRMEEKQLLEFNEQQWEIYCEKALQCLGKTHEEIEGSKKSERWKLAIANKMKRETSVSNQWLSKRLEMGAPNGVSSNCGRYRKEKEKRCEFARKINNLKFEH